MRAAALGFFFTFAACGPKSATNEDATLAEDGTDATSTEGDVELLGASLVVPDSTGLGLASAATLAGGDLAMATIGDTAKRTFLPTGCVTVTSDLAARTATYAFADCVGPYGLAAITGTVMIQYALAPNQLTLSFSATALQIHRATIASLSGQAVITSGNADAGTAGTRDMTWTASLQGTTARGRAFARSTMKEITWSVGTSCVAATGESSGTIDGQTRTIDLLTYSRCKDACPASGSEITITDTKTSASVDITYGDNTATYTANGKSINFTPLCAL